MNEREKEMKPKKIVEVKSKSKEAKLQAENKRQRERLDYYHFVIIDLLQALESIERTCKELLEEK